MLRSHTNYYASQHPSFSIKASINKTQDPGEGLATSAGAIWEVLCGVKLDMALDIYVGGFSRFFAREWENVAQKWARETGTNYRMIGPNGPPQAANWSEVAEAVTHWKAALNNGLGNNLAKPLDWDETPAAPYFTDRPGYDGYGALLVWAAHAELGSTPPD